MIGLVIVTYGEFGEALLRATEFVMGPVEQAAVVSITADDDMERRRADLAAATRRVNSGDGVMIVTDVFGGTTSNLAISIMSKDVEVIAGPNLPMMMRFGQGRHLALADCAQTMREHGRRYITRALDVLGPPVEESSPAATPADETGLDRMAFELEEIADSLWELKETLLTNSRGASRHGAIGHNIPPLDLAPDESDIFEEGETAARVAAEELGRSAPNSDVLKLCLAVLKRALRLLKEIGRWAAWKGELFATEAAKSAGKAVGPIIVVSTIALGLSDRLAAIIDQLRSVIGL